MKVAKTIRECFMFRSFSQFVAIRFSHFFIPIYFRSRICVCPPSPQSFLDLKLAQILEEKLVTKSETFKKKCIFRLVSR